MKIFFINSVQTSPLTPLHCGEGKNVETSYHGVSEGVLGLVDREIRWKKK